MTPDSFFDAAALVFVNLPACLLAALNQQGSWSMMEYCTSKQAAMLGNLTVICNAETLASAYDGYARSCANVGINVADLPTPIVSVSTTTSVLASATIPTSISATVSGDTPQDTKPTTAAAAIAPHALVFAVFGLSTTGLFSVFFL